MAGEDVLHKVTPLRHPPGLGTMAAHEVGRWERAGAGRPRVPPGELFPALEWGGDPVSQLEGRCQQYRMPGPTLWDQDTAEPVLGRGVLWLSVARTRTKCSQNVPFPIPAPLGRGHFCPLPPCHHPGREGGDAQPVVSPSPCHLAWQCGDGRARWHLVPVCGQLCPAPGPALGGQEPLRAQDSTGHCLGPGTMMPWLPWARRGSCPPSVPAQSQRGAQTRLCHDHGLCHDGSCRETNRPLSGLRHRLRFCLTDTKGLRGAGGAGLLAAGTGAAEPWAALPVPPGSRCPHPLSQEAPGGPGRDLPSPTWQVPISQSSARRRWSRSAPWGPLPMDPPRSPPQPPRRSRVASPSPAPVCCRSPSADVSAALRGHPLLVPRVPCLPLASSACPRRPLPAPWGSCLPPGSPARPLHLLPAPRVPACPWHPMAALSMPFQPSDGHHPCPAPHPPPAPPTSLSTIPAPGRPPRCPQPIPGASRRVPERGRLPAEPLSSVSSLEVHFDLLDLTELTDMSDQELAEVFADSDEENVAGESPSGERAGPSSACPTIRPSICPALSRLSPQGCSRRRCRGPGTCARPPGPERGSRAGRRSTSATQSCHRDPRTPSCPPSGRGSPRGCPGTGGQTRGHAGARRFLSSRAPLEPVPAALPGGAGAQD